MSNFSLPALTGSNLQHTKAYNLRIVLETVRTCSPISRADIARRTELTPQTVSNIVGELISSNFVDEAALRRRGRGAPSTMLQINPDVAFSVGLDLDRDHLTGVIVDLGGTVRHRKHRELNFPAPNDAVDLMEEMAEDLIAQANADKTIVSGVGVGLPGPLNITNQSTVSNAVSPEDFPGWKNEPIASDLQERLELPIHLENNATAAAVGELWYGAGKTISTFFYLYFGAGLGGGLVIDGRPYRGHTRSAGELGYLPSSLFPIMDDFPKAGSPAIIGKLFHLPHLYRLLDKSGHEAHVPADLETLYNEREQHVLEWTGRAIDSLTALVVMVEGLIDPAAVFLGGRLPQILTSAILDGLSEKLPKYRMPGKMSSPCLLEATAGENAAALGAAALPVYELFAPTSGPYPKRSCLRKYDSLSALGVSH